MSKHTDQADALARFQAYLAATADRPGSGCPLYDGTGKAVSFRTLRLVADLAEAKADGDAALSFEEMNSSLRESVATLRGLLERRRVAAGGVQ